MTDASRVAQPALDPAILQQAAEWIAQLWSDDVTDQDRTDCARWRARHPDHEQAWQRLLAFEGKLLGLPRDAARHALHRPATRAGRRRALRALSLGVIVLGAGYAARSTGTWQRAAADYRSATGEIRDLTLPDGTRVTLSTASAIDLRFSDTERLVVLRAGEILIATAPDTAAQARPFLVRTQHGSVQALGTRYSVRDDDDTTRVAVFEGAVEIRPMDAPGRAVRLDAGQGSRFSRDRVEPPAAANDDAAAWSRGLLVADGMRLEDFTAELARYRSGVVRCDPAVADLRVSGVFSLRDTDRALENLTRGLPVAVVYRTRYWVTLRAADRPAD
ncbi:FecR domain-containing protein [Achromobacter sp. DH1f]|uniref:FecR domain-containing protein n=1 Tax=Achromobacter sp. DH1f TaxID=1397275 RepID=UPI00046A3412|nr:FecR domain-containing protein [Achromobacter sp. DH1f]